MENKYKIILLGLSTFLLIGCMDVATGSAQAIYNRRSIEKNLSDQYTTMQIYQALNLKTDEFKNTNIAISTYNGEVLLAGEVPNQWQKTKAEDIAHRVSGVKEIYNLLVIASPSSSLTRISDSWITTKVKAKLIASNDVDATQIKVVTENGTVYLMGILPAEDAASAVDLANDTDGVKKVVKLFSYIHISKKIDAV